MMINKYIGYVATMAFAVTWYFIGDNILIANIYLAAGFVILSTVGE